MCKYTYRLPQLALQAVLVGLSLSLFLDCAWTAASPERAVQSKPVWGSYEQPMALYCLSRGKLGCWRQYLVLAKVVAAPNNSTIVLRSMQMCREFGTRLILS